MIKIRHIAAFVAITSLISFAICTNSAEWVKSMSHLATAIWAGLYWKDAQ